MPLLLLGAVIAICVAVYMYFFYHQDHFTREKQKPQSPFDIIYLPADLDAAKNKSSASPDEKNKGEDDHKEKNHQNDDSGQ